MVAHSAIDHTGLTGVSSGNVATDSIWDAKGDLAGGTGANTAQKLTVGANGTILMADSAATTGLKWWPGTKIVRKAATESVTSNTTEQNDDELLFAIAASETWVVTFHIFCDGADGGDIKFGLSVPASATYNFGGMTIAATATTTVGDVRAPSSTSGTLGFGTVAAGATFAIVSASIVNSTNAGNVTLQWAQGTSSGTATRVLAGSFLVAHRLA